MRRGLLSVAVLCAAGCSDGNGVTADVPYFDARDAVVEPRDRGPDDLGADSGQRVDVTLVDTSARDGGAADVARFDAPVLEDVGECAVLAEAYAEAVRATQRCVGDGQCAASVCETQCCACQVLVDPSSERYGDLARISSAWRAMGCAAVTRCPGIPCDPPSGAVCSSEGRCVTVRASVSDAGDDGG